MHNSHMRLIVRVQIWGLELEAPPIERHVRTTGLLRILYNQIILLVYIHKLYIFRVLPLICFMCAIHEVKGETGDG